MQIGAKFEVQELCPECLFEPTLISRAFASVGFHILRCSDGFCLLEV